MNIISEKPTYLVSPLLLATTPFSEGNIIWNLTQPLHITFTHLLELIVEIHTPVSLSTCPKRYCDC
jgi:hypothetical protein